VPLRESGRAFAVGHGVAPPRWGPRARHL